MAKPPELFRLAEDTDSSRPIGRIVRPSVGWLRAIREALGLSLADQARRLKVTPPAVRSFELAEAEDRITLGSLRRTAAAMYCDLVYTLLPRSGALEIPVKSSLGKAARTPNIGRTATAKPPASPPADSVVLDLTWRVENGVD